MRPQYETRENREAQRAIARRLDLVWQVETHEQPINEAFDFLSMKDGWAVQLLEIKDRTIGRRGYARSDVPDYMVSANKVRELLNCEWAWGVPAILVVQMTDGLFWHRVQRGIYRLAPGGRRDRNDPQDYGTMAHIPWDEFRAIPGK